MHRKSPTYQSSVVVFLRERGKKHNISCINLGFYNYFFPEITKEEDWYVGDVLGFVLILCVRFQSVTNTARRTHVLHLSSLNDRCCTFLSIGLQ